MLDARSVAEVLEVRVSLQGFASRQSDQVVQICCCAVDLDLARILGRQDDQMVRELAASVEQLAKAVQTARTADQGEDSTPDPRDPCPAHSLVLPIAKVDPGVSNSAKSDVYHAGARPVTSS